MDTLLIWVGRAAGGVGAVITAATALLRLSGHFWLGGLQLGTLFLAGIAALAFGCFCFLSVLLGRSRPR